MMLDAPIAQIRMIEQQYDRLITEQKEKIDAYEKSHQQLINENKKLVDENQKLINEIKELKSKGE